ncbi:T-cell receptor gamma chain V region PT-gamma-1/2, partial [Heterocephalus glaber]
MLWAVALLLAFLPAGSQISSNLEGRMMSITRRPGPHMAITCDVIFMYTYSRRGRPHDTLCYDFFNSRAVVDSDVSEQKYDAYVRTEMISEFLVRKVEESDSGVYYCAAWTATVIHTC